MRMKKLLLYFFVLTFPTIGANAQTFTNLNNGFPSLTNAAAAWADYDNDGDRDFALTGFSGVTAEVSRIYRNEGNGNFICVDSNLIAISNGSVNWGDYDNDGDPDLLINGQSGSGIPAVTVLYRNDGNDVFTEVLTSLTPIIGITRWIDFDNDGWLDVIMSGLGNSLTNDSIRLFHNNGAGNFIEMNSNLSGYYATDIAVADFDNDGDSDFFFTGGTLSSTTFPISVLYSNDGNGNFMGTPFNFINLSTGTADWGDYDNDGDLDLLYDGIDSTFGLGITLLYRNDNSGNFTLINAGLPGTGEPGSVNWGDVDNDGDLDILLGGTTFLLRNDGGDIFTDITPGDFQYGVPNSFADIDQDGDLDILVIQSFSGLYASTIFRNNLIATGNAAPLKDQPSIFTVSCANGIVTIQSTQPLPSPLSLCFFDITGRKVFSRTINLSTNLHYKFELQDLPTRMLLYELKGNAKVECTGKLLVE